MTAHKHAALMAEYAKDALETDEPWLLWEMTSKNTIGWVSLDRHPLWLNYCEYRRKSKIININGFEVPEPLRAAPPEGTRCWVVCPAADGDFQRIIWVRGGVQAAWLSKGLLHLTPEAAQLHAQALLSFTKEKME